MRSSPSTDKIALRLSHFWSVNLSAHKARLNRSVSSKYMRDEHYKPYMPLFQKELDISSEWLENSYTYTPRPYKPSKRALQMEADIKETAHKYITNEKALLLGAEGRNG